MKKQTKKLSLDKFTISKIGNMNIISGGTISFAPSSDCPISEGKNNTFDSHVLDPE